MINNTVVIHKHILFRQHFMCTHMTTPVGKKVTYNSFFRQNYFIQKVYELIVYLWNDTGNDHTGSSGIKFIALDRIILFKNDHTGGSGIKFITHYSFLH